jgi:two-component sensor histidine kinase
MVAELSHRVKNTLATVISIARQSFTKDTPIEVARAAFDGRIHALAKTHSRLAEGNWSGVSFESALLDELTPYRQADGANIRLSGPAIVLNPRNAVVLGMAYHELATNAAKYGALSSKNGTIHIEWSVTPDGMACVRWIENGGPPVSPPKRSGFGRLLLERALVSDLKGEVNMDFQPEGLLCTIKFPLRENAASAH